MFKVGDLVIGNSKNSYSITCKEAICLVLDVYASHNIMRVCLIANDIDEYIKNEDVINLNLKNYESGRCEKFEVLCDKFDLFTGVSPDNILIGLFFRKDVKKLVTLKKEYVSNPGEYVYIGEI